MHDLIKRLHLDQDHLLPFAVTLLVALLTLLVGLRLSRMVASLVQGALRRANVDAALVGFLRTLVHGVLIVVVVIEALLLVGVPSAPLVAALGASGLAIGLALQGSLSNLAWGVLLIIFRPFRAGDFIKAGGVEGTVETINLMYTQLVMPDNREAIVPNAKVGGDAIINANRRGTRRFELNVGIAYKDDIGKAIAVIRQTLADDARVLTDPEPHVRTVGLGDSSVDLVIRGWTRVDDLWPTQADLLRAIKERLTAAGISIPFPQRELTVIGGDLPRAG